MPYTNTAAVETLLGPNYGLAPDGSTVDLQQFVDSADVVMANVVRCASAMNPPYVYSPTELEMIERWLACHLYCKLDPLYASKSTSGASGSFIAPNGQNSEAERYKDGAISMDYTGCLKAMLNRAQARGAYLGRCGTRVVI